MILKYNLKTECSYERKIPEHRKGLGKYEKSVDWKIVAEKV